MDQSRKADHLKICLENNVQTGPNGLNYYYFEHQALPEIDFDQIDTSTVFLGKKLKAPLLISSLTGGTPESFLINQNLAQAAEKCRIAMAVGSQRVAIHQPTLAYTFDIRKYAPNTVLFANLGAVQLNYGFGLKECQAAIKMLDADGLILHVNPLQEAIQPEGNHDFSRLFNKIETIVNKLEKPVIIKEVGFGISKSIALKLKSIGVDIIDVAGWGGTNWAIIESARRKESQRLGNVFSNWGIPTANAIKECAQTKGVTIIGSGGIRNGLEIAKCISLGASLVGIGLPFLKPATISSKAVQNEIDHLILELKISMFCAGAKNLSELKKIKLKQQFA